MEKNIIDKKSIMEIITDALNSKIGERLNGYSSPLNNIVDEVVNENADTIREICRNALKTVVSDKQFEKSVRQEFEHKVAKSMVGKLEGSVEKAVEVLRQNPTLRAEIILVIEKMVKKNI